MNNKPPGNALLETSASELLRHAYSLVRKTAEELESVSKDLTRCRGNSSRILFITNPEGPFAELMAQLICGRGMSLDITDRYDHSNPDSVYDRLVALKYDLLIASNIELSPTYIPRLVSHARENHSTLKILVLSGWHSPGFFQDLTARGVDDYVLLPIREVELRERIFRLLPRCTQHEGDGNCSLHPNND